jgi:hypothetical protein
MSKIGRNDPCSCGSGKKYKQCCLKIQENKANEAEQERSLAAPKAIDWLHSRHGKAIKMALIESFFGGLSEEEYERFEALNDDAYGMAMINAMEWLLAEGTIQVRGQEVPVNDCLLGPGGPVFSTVQRQWIEQLGMARLGLYEVVDLVPGERMQLRDLLFPELEPIWVQEKSGSAEAALLDVTAARIMTVGDHYELSGAVYGFHRHKCLDLLNELREELEGLDPSDPLTREIIGAIIPDRSLQMLTAPFVLPDLVDMTTGQPVLFVTDHYRVNDPAALERNLAGQADIEGDSTAGWVRLLKGDDGQLRASLNVDPGTQADRIKVSYRTQDFADQGRPWFESLMDSAVTFIARDISDPKGMLSSTDSATPPAKPKPPSIPPEVMTQVIDEHMRSFYAEWADSPLPALGYQSPREAMETPEGLEQVRFLLRTYEHGEAAQARQQNRQPVSFQFLWNDLGISE